jgi:hypothetical protein
MTKSTNMNMTMAEMCYDYVLSFLSERNEELVEAWEKEEETFKSLFKNDKSKKKKSSIKKNASAYNFFCKALRTLLKEANPDISNEQIKQELSNKWKLIKDDEEQLAPYKQQAEEDKKRYDEERANMSDSEVEDEKAEKKKNKKLKDNNKPKKNCSAYICFCNEERNRVKEENPDMTTLEIGAELGVRWAVVKKDKTRMAKYIKQADEDKKRYDAEMKNYVRPSDEELMSRNKKKKERVPIVKKSNKQADEEKPKKKSSKKKKVEEPVEEEVVEEEPAEEEVVEEESVEEEVVEEEPVEEEKPKKKSSKKKKGGDEEKPKKKSSKKMTGFLIYCEEARAQIKESNPKMPAKDITKKLKEMWEELEEEEKDFYNDKADE